MEDEHNSLREKIAKEFLKYGDKILGIKQDRVQNNVKGYINLLLKLPITRSLVELSPPSQNFRYILSLKEDVSLTIRIPFNEESSVSCFFILSYQNECIRYGMTYLESLIKATLGFIEALESE